MKLTITTNPKAVENVNYVLARAIESLRNNPLIRVNMDLTEKDVNLIETFKSQMIKSFLKR